MVISAFVASKWYASPVVCDRVTRGPITKGCRYLTAAFSSAASRSRLSSAIRSELGLSRVSTVSIPSPAGKNRRPAEPRRPSPGRGGPHGDDEPDGGRRVVALHRVRAPSRRADSHGEHRGGRDADGPAAPSRR